MEVYHHEPGTNPYELEIRLVDDLKTGESWAIDFGEERYGSEPGFAPRVGAVDEDDGSLILFWR